MADVSVRDQTPSGAERELPGLAGIAAFIRWIEELITLLSGPLLTIGLAIALIDLLTGGDLLRSLPLLLFAWGACQAVGIDSQLVATFDRLRQALRAGRWWVAFGLLLLGLMLGYVGFVSAEAFGFQHAFQVTEAQALARLGIDPISWQLQRAVLAVFLVALSGFNRYHPPAKNYGAKAADEAERLKHELALEPLRAQARAAKLRNARDAVKVALGREEQRQTTPSTGIRAVGAAYGMPEPQPQEHVDYTAHLAAHGDYGIEYPITNEANYSLAEEFADDDPNITGAFSVDELDEALRDATSRPRKTARKPVNSGPVKKTKTHSELVSEGMKRSHKERKAEGRERRQRTIEADVYTVLDQWYAEGSPKGLTDGKLASEVFKLGHLRVKPSENNVSRYRDQWKVTRKREAAAAVSQPIIADDIVAMLEQEREEALV